MQHKAYNIFYTDDDYDDQELFKEVIDSIDEKHHLYSQYHGAQLLDVLRQPQPKPDLIFLDLNMPHKNGFEVLKEMRSDDKLKDIPVIIFSTSNNEEVIGICKDLGANMYISKPSSFPKLKTMMETVLSMDWKTSNSAGKQFVLPAN